MTTETNIEDNYNQFLADALHNFYIKFCEELEYCKETFNETSVHDLRVSIRRLSALLFVLEELFKIDYIDQMKSELKKILKVLSPLRDTQVQLLLIHKLYYSHPILFYFYNYILKREDKLIKKATKILKKIDNTSFNGIIFHLSLYIKNYPENFNKYHFKQIIDTTYEALCDRINQLDIEDATTIHKIRLAFKSFRYTIEVFAPIFDITKKELKILQNFQDTLGTIQDYDVLKKRIGKFISKNPKFSLRFEKVLKLINEQQKSYIELFIKELKAVNKFYFAIFRRGKNASS